MGCPQIVIGNLLACDGVLVMERHDTRIRPEHWVIAQNVRPVRICGVGLREKRHVVRLGMRPAFFERRMPKGKVLQSEDFPHTVLFDIFVLIYPAFPPLYQTARMCVLDAVMGASRHHAAEATLCTCAFIVDIDDALHLWVIEEEAMDRTVTSSYEAFREAANIEALYALFAIVATTEELDTRVRVVGIEIGNLSGLATVFCQMIDSRTSL